MEIAQEPYNYGDLPQHILVDILSLLKLSDLANAVLTCKSWYWASYNRRITKKILIDGFDNEEGIDFFQRPIQNLRMNCLDLRIFNFRKLFWTHGHAIKDLDILFQKVPVTRIFEMFIYLRNVETVKIAILPFYYSAKNFVSCKWIGRHRGNLAENLSHIKFLTIDTYVVYSHPIELFLSLCKSVKKLIWNESMPQPHDQTAFLCNFLLEPNRNPMLAHLNDLLIGCIDPANSCQILEKLVSIPLRNLKRLNLKKLSRNPYTPVFRQFCQVYRSLDEFKIHGCNDQQLAQYMTNLKTLAIKNCIAIDFEPLVNLSRLESLHIKRVDVMRDDKFIVFLNLKLKKLTKLSLNVISELALKCICANYPHLEQLILVELGTKDCEPIFRNLTKLKMLHLSFSEPAACHSSSLQSSVDFNITRLTELQELNVSCWVPGITPMLVQQLPSVRIPFGADNIFDPTVEDLANWIDVVSDDADESPEEVPNSENEKFYITDFSFDIYNDLRNSV